ncbi:MAG TPA: TerB family tellurite resistance protein [Gemmatimonadales bacterium]|nr:TerB family tellurite resistance protein [Gemmatimonadales bacterium]
MPPPAVYAVLGLLSAVENILPPVPSDAAVALGAFLSNRGVTTPLAVFLVTWLANLLGAAGVYLASRHYGRRLFASPTGRRLLAPRSLALIEREYLRLGTIGIFVSRFLPGIRAVVPPFAGLVGLGAVRTFVPMGLASAIWYGGITMLGAVIGSEWARISAFIAGVNRTLGIAALILALAAGAWFLLRRRERRRERVWHATRDALDPAAPSFLAGTDIAEGSAREAAALVVLELAYADPVLTAEDRRLIAEHLHARWGLGTPGTPPAPPPEDERRMRFADYARRLRKRVGRTERLELVERMWTVAFADGAIGEHEARLMHLAAELLAIGPAELAEVSRRLQARHQV